MRDEEVEERQREKNYEAAKAVDSPDEAEDDGLRGDDGGGSPANDVVAKLVERRGFGEGRGIVRVQKRTLVRRRRGNGDGEVLRLRRRRRRRRRRRELRGMVGRR